MNEYSLSIVIPCYNEAENIPILIDKISKFDFDNNDIEIIIVDNASTDNSEEVINILLNKLQIPNIKTVKVSTNQGYGYGILQGLKEANGKLLSWTHADLQTDISDVINAYKCYNNLNEDAFVKGKRRKRKLLESILTFGMQIVVFCMLKIWLDDINAQPKLFSREFYNKYIENKAPNDFSLDLYACYMAKKHSNIKTIPVFFNKRLYGESKGGSGSTLKTKINVIKRTIKYISKLKFQIK